MSRRTRIATTLVLLGVSAALAGGFAVAQDRPKVPSGTYTGARGTTILSVARGASISLAAFDFRCKQTLGRVSLNEIRIRRVRGRYRFSIRTYGSVAYRDGTPDENARVRFSGRFSRNAARVTGTFRVTSPYCGSTGDVQWSARR